MKKRAIFFIDDNIWIFRDLTRQKPKSMFDNPYLAMLKKAHDEFGVKTQLNVFYKTSSWYGNDEFCLSDMTDAYKKEWEASSDWLRLAFHAKEEWPDYPYVNADYKQVYDDFNLTKNEIIRFAGEKSFTNSVVPHWAPISKEGVKALADSGIKVTYATYGIKKEFSGNHSDLPYGHSFRLIQNKKPETGVYKKFTRDLVTSAALCSYNHVAEKDYMAKLGKFDTIKDKELDVSYMLAAQTVLNLIPLELMEDEFSKFTGQEFLSVGNHEQYFYSDYYAYQPDYIEKVYKMGKIMKEAGYEFIFAEELPCQ